MASGPRGKAVNQAELRQMAEDRLLDAKALLDGGRWSYGYYVAGYAVECALKSCLLARMIHTGWVFEEKAKFDECRTHDFTKLVQVAGLRDLLNTKLTASAAAGDDFVGNWDIVTEWKVTSRYESTNEHDTKELYAAITDAPDGVMLWIRNYW
jgi:HEPN domain-containing protein